MPEPTLTLGVRADGRDHFRTAVAALPIGPLRDVLVAVAYARDAAARTGAAVPDDRWLAIVAAAERAVQDNRSRRPAPSRRRVRPHVGDPRSGYSRRGGGSDELRGQDGEQGAGAARADQAQHR